MLRSGGVMALAALCATPAAAETIPANLRPSLSYEVSGRISAYCSLVQGSREVAIAAIANPATDTVRATSVDLGFALDCNNPVRVRLSSNNGGLETAVSTSDPAFLRTVSYDATVHLPGMPSVLRCRSRDMTPALAACQADTATAVASGAGRIAVTVPAQDGLLLAGTYRDRVTLTITPVLGGEDRG